MIPYNPILVDVPEKYRIAIETGKMIVEGVRLKWTDTNQYAGFLQPSGPFSQMLLSLPSSANPITTLAQTTSGFAANIQLNNMLNMLSSIQTMVGIGTVASIANIGISIGGFALVLNKLRAMHEDIKFLSSKVVDIKEYIRLEHIVTIETALERYEESFLMDKTEIRRIELWKETQKELHKAYNFTIKEIFHENGSEVFSKFSNHKDYDYEVIEKILLFPSLINQVRTEVSLLLKEPITAKNNNLKYLEFLNNIKYNPKSAILVKKNPYEDEKKFLKLVSDTKNSKNLIESLKNSLITKDLLIESIMKKNIDSRNFIYEIRNNSEPKLLFFSLEESNEVYNKNIQNKVNHTNSLLKRIIEKIKLFFAFIRGKLL